MGIVNTVAGRRPEGRGMWFGIADDLLIPTALRPVQFHDIWSRSRTISPERRLALAVVQQALNDLAGYRFARGWRRQRLYWDAYAWVADDDREWPYSFINLCEAAGLGVEAIRQRVLDPTVPAEGATPAINAERDALGKAA